MVHFQKKCGSIFFRKKTTAGRGGGRGRFGKRPDFLPNFFLATFPKNLQGFLWSWIVFEWVCQGLQVPLWVQLREESGEKTFRDSFRPIRSQSGWVGRVGLVIDRLELVSGTSICCANLLLVQSNIILQES